MAAVAVCLFRRDLRLPDNPAFSAAAAASASYLAPAALLPLFVLDPVQADPRRNPYYSANAVRFMLDALRELDGELRARALSLYVVRGRTLEVLGKLAQRSRVVCIYVNGDVTPFARQRDAALEEFCRMRDIRFWTSGPGESTLVDPSTMEKPYQVFTPFYRRYYSSARIETPRARAPPPPLSNKQKLPKEVLECLRSFQTYKEEKEKEKEATAPEPAVRGGRSHALAILRAIRRGAFDNYESSRQAPGLPAAGTTKLSAYLKFGCISIREALEAAQSPRKKNEALVRQLYWRAFYDQVAYHFPRVLSGRNRSLRPAYDRVRWRTGAGADSDFDAWAAGRTGFPIVDAGMRQLLRTGFMHNRLRMVAASFLIKDLALDWRWGERHFARHLIDYHPSANSGGWQWASGGGADSQQYTRVFNPWLQAQKFDPECAFIKAYVPELAELAPKDILDPLDRSGARRKRGYPAPMVDHAAAAGASVRRIKAALHSRR